LEQSIAQTLAHESKQWYGQPLGRNLSDIHHQLAWVDHTSVCHIRNPKKPAAAVCRPSLGKQ
jgi:hypothetical protein